MLRYRHWLTESPRTRRRLSSLALSALLALFASGCVDLGHEPVTVMQGQLMTGPGVVFAERGELWAGTFELATTFEEDGHFEIPVSGDGLWGFHAYLEGYIYLPIQVDIGRGLPTTVTQPVVDWEQLCDGFGRCNWVEQSTNAAILTPEVDDDPTDNPVISNPHVVRAAPGIFQVSLDVFDPNGDLSNQILVHHIASGIASQLNPPGPIVDGDRPNGTYTGTVLIPEDRPQGGPWQFLAADHQCSNSQILEVLPE
ncbi:MAG: hypothetical protein GXP55_02190 [Deltaproteobacteria bacterium]|nr:hypothetical protein [Deltaproteobacteria bacterium]